MKHSFYLFSLLIVIFSSFNSCSILYGIKKIETFDKNEYDSFLKDIPNTLNYTSLISSSDQFRLKISSGEDEQERNDFGQPIQIMYFKNKELVSFHANCYAKGGIKSLNWNTDNRFSYFVPKSAKTLTHNNTYGNVIKEIYPEIDYTVKEYTIVIFWSTVLKKISMSAIQTVFENLEDFSKHEECDIYLVNTDYFFSEIL